MKDDLEQLLRNLHLKKIAEILDEELTHADQHQLAYGTFLARLLRAQYHHRQETALAWRIKNAGLPEQWTIESFPFKRQPGVSTKQIRSFAELEFIPKAENIVFIGPTGVGKTGLAPVCCSRPFRTAIAAASSGRRTSSMKCMRRWRTAPPAGC